MVNSRIQRHRDTEEMQLYPTDSLPFLPWKVLGNILPKRPEERGRQQSLLSHHMAALPATAPCPKDWTETPSSSSETPTDQPLPGHTELYPR